MLPQTDDGEAVGAYRAPMAPRPRTFVWLSALGIGVFQVVGSFGAADNQPERRAIDAVAVVLVLLGPAALGRRLPRRDVTA